jgi:hypothetical protein
MAKAKTKPKKRNSSQTWVEGTSFGPKMLDRPDNWWHWDDSDGNYELGVTVLIGRSKRDEDGNRLDDPQPEALVEVAGPYGAIATQTIDWSDIDDLDERAKRFGAAFRSLPEEYQHALDRGKNLHPLWAAAQKADRQQPKAVDDVVLAMLENPNGKPERASSSNRARAKRLSNPRNY